MTYEENRQRIKNEALNAIAKIYNPHNFGKSTPAMSYSPYEEDGGYGEQRDTEIQRLIENMNKQLEAIKPKKALPLEEGKAYRLNMQTGGMFRIKSIDRHPETGEQRYLWGEYVGQEHIGICPLAINRIIPEYE